MDSAGTGRRVCRKVVDASHPRSEAKEVLPSPGGGGRLSAKDQRLNYFQLRGSHSLCQAGPLDSAVVG